MLTTLREDPTPDEILSLQDTVLKFISDYFNNQVASEYDDFDDLPSDVIIQIADYLGIDEESDMYEYLDMWDQYANTKYLNCDDYRIEYRDDIIYVYEVTD